MACIVKLTPCIIPRNSDVVDMGILHDGVNMTVCVDVSMTGLGDTTGCGLSTNIIPSV